MITIKTTKAKEVEELATITMEERGEEEEEVENTNHYKMTEEDKEEIIARK